MELEISFGKVKGSIGELAQVETRARDLAKRFDPSARVRTAFRRANGLKGRALVEVQARIGGESLRVVGGGATIAMAIESAFHLITSRLASRQAYALVAAVA